MSMTIRITSGDNVRHSLRAYTADADEQTPRLLDSDATDLRERLDITYTSTMLSGKVVIPDDLVAATIGDPAAFAHPPRVRRCAQYVRRDGEYLSPISRGVLRKTP